MLRAQSVATLALAIVTAALPRSVQAQAQITVSSTVTRDPTRNVVSTIRSGGAIFHPDRVLVRFRNRAPRVFLPGSVLRQGFPRDADLFVVQNPPGISVAEAVRRYRSSANVLYAEPDFIVQVVATPNDSRWSDQWDMVAISAPAAWNTQTSSSDIVVAVIDTGIDYTHPDLVSNLWTGPSGEHGFTCMNGTCTTGGSDDFGHGTHVAGTIGAVGNNNTGIAGINWSVQLLSLKFLDSGGGGYVSDAVVAFQKVAELKQQGVNIRITSNSWGGGGPSQALKDAMAAAEALGIVDVCAAGNSGQNADVNPMYPAAYDNRGIVSVLASDVNDVGASFTNYGLASVDIAAPGVSTLSTVPTGPCTLCDASGYKYLSGTSMATPHVSGVMAALLHLNPSLSAAKARDVLLDPGSYDAVGDAKTKSTSSGGRLNFAKTIANTPALSKPLNTFPTLAMGPDAFATYGSQVTLSASGSDADFDLLRTAWNKSVSTAAQWLFGWMLDAAFPIPSGSSVSFAAPLLSRTATVPYDAAVADSRGGGASGRNYVTVSAAASAGSPPSGTFSLSATDVPVGSTVIVNYPVTDPDGNSTAFDLWIGQMNGATGSCCYTGAGASITFNAAGVYRVSTQAMDQTLNAAAARGTDIVRVGGATGVPPIASAVLDQLSGPVPLTVNIDMSGSTGAIQYYFMSCGGGGLTAGSSNAIASCTFTTPGAYWLLLQVQDTAGLNDIVSAYVVATPAPSGPDVTPPTVSITTPTGGTTVASPVSTTASASDNSSGVAKVEFFADVVDAAHSLGVRTGAPYTVSATLTAGGHTLYAVATDGAGNIGTSPGVAITVSAPPPPPPPATAPTITALSLSPSPVGGSVARKSSENIQATATQGTSATSRVEFTINGNLQCSATTPSSTTPSLVYSCKWQVPASTGKTYKIQATAYDTNNLASAPSAVTVTAK